MTFTEFIEEVKTEVASQLGSEKKVTIYPVIKNNDTVYQGLFIVDPVVNVSPTIYLNPYYHRYLDGVPMEDIIVDILDTYRLNMPEQDFDISTFTDFSKARENIVTKLINTKRNEQLLKKVPNKAFLDLSIVFVCVVSNFVDEYASILIHNEHLKLWGITEEELYEVAMENTPKQLPYKLEDIKPYLEHRSGFSLPDLLSNHMYILSNPVKVFGAACMAYTNVLKEISERLEDNLIIIPSSIHEVMIIPEHSIKGECSISEMNQTVEEVNETQLTDDEILGDHIYYFDGNELKIAE